MSVIRKIKKGFTLVELLVVIVIIGVIAGVLFLAMAPMDNKAKEEVCYYNRALIVRALETYRLSNGLSKETYTLQSFINDKYKDTMSTNNAKCPSGGIYTAGTDENGREIVLCSVHSVTPGGGGPSGGTGNYISGTESFGNPGILPNSTWPTPVYDSTGTVVTNKVTFPTGSSFAYVNTSGVTEFYIVTAWAGSITFGRNKDAITPVYSGWGPTEIIKVSSREVVKWSEVTASTPIFTIGDVVYDDRGTPGKYYIARGTGNINNAPGSGNWVEIK